MSPNIISYTYNSRLLPGSSVPLVAFKQLKFCFYYNFIYRVGCWVFVVLVLYGSAIQSNLTEDGGMLEISWFLSRQTDDYVDF